MIEYFSGETLRWSFGFDNPNKAAVVFACLLPLCWWGWMAAWHWEAPWKRMPGVILSAMAFLAAGFCLIATFSRGGLVAVVVALGYVWVKTWRSDAGRRGAPGRLFPVLSLLLILVLAGMAVWWGLASRSAAALEGDASVGNRFVLWRAGLQMAADHPGGFGRGNSGESYMQWYQPVEMTARYRTMVNSYLTFLVERGWLPFLGLVFVVFVFWTWARPGQTDALYQEAVAALRGVLVAFAAAAVFSTTMEEPLLWILPGLATTTLGTWSLAERIPLSAKKMALATALTLLAGGALFGCGRVFAASDSLARSFGRSPSGIPWVRLRPQAAEPSDAPVSVVPDSEVLGPDSGKLLRRLCLETGRTLWVGDDTNLTSHIHMIVGTGARRTSRPPNGICLLVAPAITSKDAASRLLTANTRTIIALPEIDEDGRSTFWINQAEGRAGVEMMCMEGVGIQVDWAWDQVVALVGQL